MVFAVLLHGYYLLVEADTTEFVWNYKLLGQFFGFITVNKFVEVLFAIILIVSQAILLNDIVIKHKLSRALSTIPGAMFVLLSSTILVSEIFHPVLLANLFFLFSLQSLFKIYKRHQPIVTIFNAGLFMAMAAIVYPPYLIFIVILLLGLISLRNIELRETLQMAVGVLAPFYLLGVFLFFKGSLKDMLYNITSHSGIPWTDWEWTAENLAKPLMFLLLILVAIIFNNSLQKKKKFDAIKKIELCNWMLLLSFFSIFLMKDLGDAHLMILATPLAILSGLIMENKNNSVVKEFIFLILIAVHGAFVLGVV